MDLSIEDYNKKRHSTVFIYFVCFTRTSSLITSKKRQEKLAKIDKPCKLKKTLNFNSYRQNIVSNGLTYTKMCVKI